MPIAGDDDGDDEASRLIIAVMAKRGELSEEERTQAVKDLLSDGLTVGDINELVPQLLCPSHATPSGTRSDRLPTVKTTLQLSPEPVSKTGSSSTT